MISKTLPWCVLITMLWVGGANSQSARSLINEGNDRYEEGQYGDAEINYRKALEQEEGTLPGHFNLGNVLHKQGKFDQSVKEFDASTGLTQDAMTRSQAFYNKGNSYLKADQYEQAVQSYIESLKLNPADQDAKYNLSYALNKLRQQQQQQQGGGDNKDQQKDQKQDQNDQKDEKDQKEQQNRQDQQNQQDQENRQQQARQPQQQQMSQADAERILDVLKNQEKDVQKKLRAKVRARAKTEKDW